MLYRAASGIYLQRLDSDVPVPLTRADSDAVYLPTGWLVWVRQGTLVAQRLDVAHATLTGEQLTIADGVVVEFGRGAVAVAANGSIAYRLNTARALRCGSSRPPSSAVG
jgi:hypothetical protein